MPSIHIACNINSDYIQHCTVMLVSLFTNNPNANFHIHIITSEISQSDINILQQTTDKFNARLTFYVQHEDFLAQCPIDTQGHISRETYYRCFLTSILPSQVHKVLYLDCDLIVRGKIEKLWNTNIDQYAVACVEDMWSALPENYSRLKYSPEYSYFNAGVLLINLDYWREHDIVNQSIHYITTYPENLLFNDQDVLNALLYDKKIFIDFQWNMQDGFFRRKRKISPDTWSEIDKAMTNPIILHYTGSKKPWHYKSEHPYKSEYFKYLDMTPWQGKRPPVELKTWWIKQINGILRTLKILPQKYRKTTLRQ